MYEELIPITKEIIKPLLQEIMNKYLEAKSEPFANHLMGELVRKKLVNAFTTLDFLDKEQYEIKGSVGQGNWATVPWLAIMNKEVTTSTQRGYYIVYLFSDDMERLYLTLAQGVTESSKDQMQRFNDEIRSNIDMDQDFIKDNDIVLGSSNLAKKYELSTAAYIAYSKDLPSEEKLQHDLKRMLSNYEQQIEKSSANEKKEEEVEIEMIISETINHIHNYIKSKGFYYEKEEVINLFLSLKTKPFVILSGISGTGKTMIVKWFAEAIGATEHNGQFTIIPVRPDWSDGSDLLGYRDIKGDFKEGPLTKVIKLASRNPEKPYIVLLDEMNLARVEYYFSDVLSVMESRSFDEDGNILTSTILTEDVAGENIYLTANLYIIGTVNMDETTHPFSKKVLDRANTIEFNRVQLNYLDFLQELKAVEPLTIKQEVLESDYIHLKDVYKDKPEIVHQVTEVLVDVNKILEKLHAHVGYRVRDEISMYIAYSQEGQVMEFNQAMDNCLLQKILPRISGSDRHVKEALDELIQLCAYEVPEDIEEIDLSYAKYPKSAEKLIEMRRRLVDGFTSFWIS